MRKEKRPKNPAGSLFLPTGGPFLQKEALAMLDEKFRLGIVKVAALGVFIVSLIAMFAPGVASLFLAFILLAVISVALLLA